MENEQTEKLIRAYLAGDEKSLELLFGQYLKPIYNFVCRYLGSSAEAEDITQEVFVKVWRNLKKYRYGSNFKTWIFCIARNTIIDFLRKKKDKPFCNFENESGENILLETLSDPAPLPPEVFEFNNLSSLLSSALDKLNPKDRLILFLHYNDHFTFREIAQTMAEPLNTVKSRHLRAISSLRKLLVQDR
jgi:RNA polymerase sigma factor (sigma-70 family)